MAKTIEKEAKNTEKELKRYRATGYDTVCVVAGGVHSVYHRGETISGDSLSDSERERLLDLGAIEEVTEA